MPIRRLPLGIGDSADLRTVVVDVDSLAVDVAVRRYTRLGAQRWRRWRGEDDVTTEFDVDAHGLVVDQPSRFRRSRHLAARRYRS